MKGRLRRRVKVVQKPSPIVVVPDKSYIGDDGNVIPTDVILIADPEMYSKMQAVLSVWAKEKMGVPGRRGAIDG
ncbi:MAG TPA: hypothetical protein ENH82_06950 [bacterium]|nr:hypothetical protein [bacterium]